MLMTWLYQKFVPIGMILMILATVVLASEERGTKEEAQALVARAIEHYHQVGREVAFPAFEDSNGEFIDHDLYVFVFGPERKIVAHGGDPELVVTAASSLSDVDGVPFGTMFMDEATGEGIWINYKWQDPVSGKVLPKASWVVLFDGYVFGVGIYR